MSKKESWLDGVHAAEQKHVRMSHVLVVLISNKEALLGAECIQMKRSMLTCRTCSMCSFQRKRLCEVQSAVKEGHARTSHVLIVLISKKET